MLQRSVSAASAAASRSRRSGRPVRASGKPRRRRSPTPCRRPAGRPGRARAERSGRPAAARRSSCRRRRPSPTQPGPPVERLDRGRALGVERLADLVVDERLPGRRGEGAGEVLAGARVGRLELNDLRLPLLLARLREVEPRELAERVGVLRSQHDDPVLGVDRLVGLARRSAGRSRARATPATFCGFSSVFFCALQIDGTPLEPPPPRNRSPTPVPPAPTPKITKPPPRATARKTNIHLAWRRSRGKNIVSSIDGAVERLAPRGAATAASCFGRFVLLLSNRAIATFLSSSAVRRPPE